MIVNLPAEPPKSYRDKLLSLGDFEGHPFRGNQYTDGDGGGGAKWKDGVSDRNDVVPSDRSTWIRPGDGWHTSEEGEKPYGWIARPHADGYEPPPRMHKMVRDGTTVWGYSHGNSQAITASSAKQMGIGGFKEIANNEVADPVANTFLTAIAEDEAGSEEPLYHAFENVRHTTFKPGDTLRLPLTATAGKPELGYGTRSEADDQKGPPVVFAFPKGTPMAGYSTLTDRSAKEAGYETAIEGYRDAGHIWDEAIVAGGFEVQDVKTIYAGTLRGKNGIGTGGQLYGQLVTLKPTEVFVPGEGWKKRG